MTTKHYSNTTLMILCGLFAAITAICSFITIPLGFTPIPINLGTLAVFLTGGILGKKYGTISMVVYVFLGAAGVPVFAGFRGGIAVLAGPTGGYIIGYIAAVLIIGIFADMLAKSSTAYSPKSIHFNYIKQIVLYGLAMTAGLAICYAFGTAWFMVSTGTDLWAALISCVFPFLPGDAVKIIAAAILVKKLRPLLN